MGASEGVDYIEKCSAKKAAEILLVSNHTNQQHEMQGFATLFIFLHCAVNLFTRKLLPCLLARASKKRKLLKRV